MTKAQELPSQNDISASYSSPLDLRKRSSEVLADAVSRLSFTPEKLLSESGWWNPNGPLGAIHYFGTFEGKDAVLKIQGVKPSVSEADMIQSFARNNSSALIRPPHLYAALAWDDTRSYEAIVFEHIHGPRLVPTPATREQIQSFFNVYTEYRQHCLQNPWVQRPALTLSESVKTAFQRWRSASFSIFPDHPLRKAEDQSLIDAAVNTLITGYSGVEPEFVHGHFGETDLYHQGDNIVLLSNLYWSWRAPLYDAVFGYHWYMYHLASADSITPSEIEAQRHLWLSAITERVQALPIVNPSKTPADLLRLALLERAAAGLNLDSLSLAPQIPLSAYLVEETRKEVARLLNEL